MPDENTDLFSVKQPPKTAAAQPSMKKNAIRRGDGTIAASGKLVNDLYVSAIRMCVPRHAAEVHLATQAETL